MIHSDTAEIKWDFYSQRSIFFSTGFEPGRMEAGAVEGNPKKRACFRRRARPQREIADNWCGLS